MFPGSRCRVENVRVGMWGFDHIIFFLLFFFWAGGGGAGWGGGGGGFQCVDLLCVL